MRPSLQKSRTLRRVKTRVPGSKVVVHYVARKPAKGKCADCKKVLPGVSSSKKLSKSQKRPERPFGGVLCSSCSRRHIIAKVRS